MKTPVRYSPELADEICRRLAEGQSLNAICQGDDMPVESAVRAWALENVDGFAARYARARELQAHFLADEIIRISDEADLEPVPGGGKLAEDGAPEEPSEFRMDATAVARNRLRVDSRKWYLSKVLPKVYGDKLALEHSGTVGIADTLRQARERRRSKA